MRSVSKPLREALPSRFVLQRIRDPHLTRWPEPARAEGERKEASTAGEGWRPTTRPRAGGGQTMGLTEHQIDLLLRSAERLERLAEVNVHEILEQSVVHANCTGEQFIREHVQLDRFIFEENLRENLRGDVPRSSSRPTSGYCTPR